MSHAVNMGLQRLIESGLPVSVSVMFPTPWHQETVDLLAREFGFWMSAYFGEASHDPQYAAPPREKTDSLVAMLARLKPGLNMVITHVGIDGPELGALVDMNTSYPLPDMSKHRQGELDALTSQTFRDAIRARNVRLLTYRQVMEMQGLKAMRRPGG